MNLSINVKLLTELLAVLPRSSNHGWETQNASLFYGAKLKMPLLIWGFIKNPPEDDFNVVVGNLLKENSRCVSKTTAPKINQGHPQNNSALRSSRNSQIEAWNEGFWRGDLKEWELGFKAWFDQVPRAPKPLRKSRSNVDTKNHPKHGS